MKSVMIRAMTLLCLALESEAVADSVKIKTDKPPKMTQLIMERIFLALDLGPVGEDFFIPQFGGGDGFDGFVASLVAFDRSLFAVL